MVSEDGERASRPAQIVSPMSKSFYHGKQLSFVDVIVAFCGGKGGGVVCDRVKLGLPSFF